MLFEHVRDAFSCFLIFLALSFSSMLPNYNVHSLAVLCRKAAKHGEINPEEAASLAADSNFVVEHSHVNLLSDLRSGLSTSEAPSGINTSSQHSVFAVTSHSVSSTSVPTEIKLANSKQPQFFINPTHGSDDVEGDLDLFPDWEYHVSRRHQMENTNLHSDKPWGMS